MRRHRFFRLARRAALPLILGLPSILPSPAPLRAQEPIEWAAALPPARHVEVQLEVRGKLQVRKPDEQGKFTTSELPLTVDGSITFDERPFAESGQPLRAARQYRTTEVKTTVNQRQFTPDLPESRRRIVASVVGVDVALHSPDALLSQEQQEMLDIQADSLVLDQLLPATPLARGESWPLPTEALAAVFGLGAVTGADAQGTVGETRDGLATLRLRGDLDGAVDSVATQIRFTGELQYDLQNQQIAQCDLEFSEVRKVSGGQPGLDVQSRLRVTLRPIAVPSELSDTALAGVSLDPAADSPQLERTQAGYQLAHDPRWRIIVDSPRNTALRFIDQGDLIAQASFSKLTPLATGRQLTLEGYQEEVRKALTTYQGSLIKAEERTTENGVHLLRVTAAGEVEKVPVEWIYYHAADAAGNRLACVFTIESKVSDRFQGADETLLEGLSFPAPTTARK